MNEPANIELWNKIKQQIKDKHKKRWNAYYSGLLVQEYKNKGGKFVGKKNNEIGIGRWFKEEWKDVGSQSYPVYRPTKKINKKTPLTVGEIDKENLQKQIKLKQKIQDGKNLPPFKPRKTK
jgi:hypothetical protein